MRPGVIFSIVLLSACLSCGKESHYSSNVDRFVVQLIDGDCDSYKALPLFDSNDIPALLGYADFFQEINCFPVSIVSSYLPSRYILGECLLRTIELIKDDTGDGNWNYDLWVPMLMKDGFDLDSDSSLLDRSDLTEVYNLYQDWWDAHSPDQDFEEFRDIDVLEDSGYHWLF